MPRIRVNLKYTPFLRSQPYTFSPPDINLERQNSKLKKPVCDDEYINFINVLKQQERKLVKKLKMELKDEEEKNKDKKNNK